MSLRLRLTLWYTGILAATLVLVFAIAYIVLQVALNQQVDQLLTARERQYSVTLIRTLQGATNSRLRDQAATVASLVFGANPDVYAQLVTLDGTPLLSTPNLANGLPVDQDMVKKVTSTRTPAVQTIQLDSLLLRIDYFPITSDQQQVIGFVQLGQDVTQTAAALRSLREVLIFAGAGGILAAFAAGWILARQALKPIERIAETAQDIGTSQDFSRRVNYRGPPDELGRLAATFNDMLERIQAAYRQIESALAAQRRFVADASHELRTPLTTIRGNIGLLAGTPQVTVQDSREALDDMASEAERMSRLVSNLLTLARADAGLHFDFDQKAIRLDEVMHDVYRQTKVLSNGVTLSLGSAEPVGVPGSSDFLKQLLLILVDNALKNTPAGGRVEISNHVEGDRVKLTVRDTGKGIPGDALPHIFERFYQADKSRSGGGTGLGLAIAKWIAEEHQGHITVESQPGRGSSFTVWLPALPVVVSSLPAAIA